MKTKSIGKSLMLFFISSFAVNVFGQLYIDTTMTPAQLVQNVFVGTGISVNNVTLSSGTVGMYGSFTGGDSTNLGLNSGIILSTAIDVTKTANPASFFSSDSVFFSGDTDFAALTTEKTYDACVLDFNFIPQSETVSFRYVFGSEEYPDWVCTKYNDIFAFFITGQNPSGPAYSNTNIALVPGTTFPVAINTINTGIVGDSCLLANCSYCTGTNESLIYTQYFVNNISIGGNTITFNGFTQVFTATAAVVPSQQYHMRIGVTDVGDSYYNSGIFLEANSFSASNVSFVSAASNEITIYPNPADENIIVEILQKNLLQNNIITICNIHGQLIIQQPIRQAKTEIDIKPLTKGAYILKVGNAEGMLVKMIVKE